jgi:RNA polymerase sigma-70 factor, ECF subfamily
VDFEEFFRAEALSLGRAVYLLTGDRGEAEDLVQEAMARAYERWDRVQQFASPAGYVYKTALNLLRRRRRRAALRPVFASSPSPDPAEVGGARGDLQRALRSLSHQQREASSSWSGWDFHPRKLPTFSGSGPHPSGPGCTAPRSPFGAN